MELRGQLELVSAISVRSELLGAERTARTGLCDQCVGRSEQLGAERAARTGLCAQSVGRSELLGAERAARTGLCDQCREVRTAWS